MLTLLGEEEEKKLYARSEQCRITHGERVTGHLSEGSFDRWVILSEMELCRNFQS